MRKLQKKETTIALHGSYYGHNFGDILLLAIYRKWINEYNLKFNVHVPFASDDLTNTIQADGNDGFKSVRNSQALIYCGGGYLGEPNVNKMYWGFRNIYRHVPVGKYASLLKKPYAIIGVGAGPISNIIARKMMVRLCNKAKLVTVRDQESYDYLRQYGVKNDNLILTADAVLHLNRKDIEKKYFENAKLELSKFPYTRKIGLHLAGNRNVFGNINLIKDDIVAYAKKNKDIGFVLFNDSFSSLFINKEMQKILDRQAIIVPYTNPFDLVALVSQLDMVVSTKLHVCITAIVMNKLALSFPLHNKTLRFFKQIDAENLCVPLSNYRKGMAYDSIATLNSNTETYITVPSRLRELSGNNRVLLNNFLSNYIST